MAATQSAAAHVYDLGAAADADWTRDIGALTGSNRALVVKVGTAYNSASAGTSMAYGGQALTRILGAGGTYGRNEIWILNEAGVAAASTTILQMIAPEARRWGLIAEKWQDAEQTTLYENATSATGTSTAPAVTVTSATGDVACCAIIARTDTAYDAAATAGDTETGQTPYGQNDSDNNSGRLMASYAAGAASVVLDYTLGASDNWYAIGFSLKSAAGADTTGPLLARLSPTLNGAAVQVGDGAVRQRSLRFESGEYTTPFYLKFDGAATAQVRVDSLPATVTRVFGTVAVSSTA